MKNLKEKISILENKLNELKEKDYDETIKKYNYLVGKCYIYEYYYAKIISIKSFDGTYIVMNAILVNPCNMEILHVENQCELLSILITSLIDEQKFTNAFDTCYNKLNELIHQ